MLKSGVVLRGVLPLELCNGSSCQLESSHTLDFERRPLPAIHRTQGEKPAWPFSQSRLSQTLKVIPPVG